jgi:hypothetical protein
MLNIVNVGYDSTNYYVIETDTGDLPPASVAEYLAPAVQQSWEQIRAHNVHVVYPGHGPVQGLT